MTRFCWETWRTLNVWLGNCADITDDKITDQVRIKLASDPVVKGGALQVDVKQGVVTLSGPVETAKQKARAERLTKKVKGVKQVVNQIEIKSR